MKVLIIGHSCTGTQFFSSTISKITNIEYYGELCKYSTLPSYDKKLNNIIDGEEDSEYLKSLSNEERVNMILEYYAFINSKKNNSIVKLSCNRFIFNSKLESIINDADIVIFTIRNFIDILISRNTNIHTNIYNIYIHDKDILLNKKMNIEWVIKDEKILEMYDLYCSWYFGLTKYFDKDKFNVCPYSNDLMITYGDWLCETFNNNQPINFKPITLKKDLHKNYNNNIILKYDKQNIKKHIVDLIRNKRKHIFL